MKIPIYQVDAFTSKLFGGNPAAVCPLEDWLEDDLMQKIAIENNLAETAFFIQTENGYHLRWFTPEIEMDLCGHATLASAHTIIHHLGDTNEIIHFDSMSGPLAVRKKEDLLELDFPSRIPERIERIPEMDLAFSYRPIKYRKARDYFLVLNQRNK